MKKFEEIYNIEDYEILTDDGYKDIEKVMKTIPYQIYTVTFDDGTQIDCADNHIFITEKNKEVYARNSYGEKIKTKKGVSKVINISVSDDYVNMYDIQMKEHHKYYTNDILSHNTTTVAGYLLHHAIFNKKYNIACLANKLDQAQEILTRIKDSYEGLPWFLQMGVKTWNKKSIELDNGTVVFVAATTGSAVRGKSINCFSKNTNVTVRDKITNKQRLINFDEMEKNLNEKLRK